MQYTNKQTLAIWMWKASHAQKCSTTACGFIVWMQQMKRWGRSCERIDQYDDEEGLQEMGITLSFPSLG